MGLFDRKKEDSLKQNLDEKAKFQPLFQMYLLFENKPIKPNATEIQSALINRFGKIDIVSENKALTSFAVKQFQVTFKEGIMPAQVMMAEVTPFDQNKISTMERTQLWDVENGNELLADCNYSLMVSDFMSSLLDYKVRCRMLVSWLETSLSLFPDCKVVWIPSAGKLHTVENVMSKLGEGDAKFINLAVNVRLFNIEGTTDKLIDTLGLYAIGLPDVQYHFHDLNPNSVANHAYNVASYIFNNDSPIKSGETIDGLDDKGININVQWKCQYETALIQPVRDVMDICPGVFASGNRIE